MPGDPEFCRQNAARCTQLASGVTDRHLKEALAEVAQSWEQLADKIEACESDRRRTAHGEYQPVTVAVSVGGVSALMPEHP
jgi:hypothetical protein